jgi:hypothetical protein
MTPANAMAAPSLEVVDAFEHPHGGRILRIRALEGATPSLRDLRRATLRAVSPDGEERRARVLSFPLTGGKPSDARFRATGRVDVLVEEEGGGEPISLGWRLHVGG